MTPSASSSPREAGLRPAFFVKWLGVVWAVVALFLYLRTLAPGVITLDDDTLEFQLVAVRGAIPHPTGYPLYAMLLTLTARLLAMGDIAYRANLLSAVIAAGAVGVTYYVARRLNMGRVAASGTALLFAISPTFWAHATIAEVYVLHLLLSALLWWRFLRWFDHIERYATGQAPKKIPSTLPPDLFFIIGLGLAHHRMMVLWLPALCFAWLTTVRTYRLSLPTLKNIAVALFAFALPLLLYLWLPIRSSVGSIDGTYNQVGFACWVTACQYTGFFSNNALVAARPLSYFATLTLHELSAVGVILALLGAIYLARVPLAKRVLLGVGLLTNALFAFSYLVPDPEVFWFPTVWLLCLFAGIGIQQLMELLKSRNAGVEAKTSPVWSGIARNGVAMLGITLLLGFLLTTRWTTADRSLLTGNPTLNGTPFNGQDVLNQPLPDDSVVIGLLGEITYLRYLQEANGIAPAIATAGGDAETLRLAALDTALASGQHPFLTRELAGLGSRYALSALGPLIEVLPQPRTTVPDGLYPLHQPVTDAITLAAWTRSPIIGNATERLTVAWQVTHPITTELNVSARVVFDDDTLACNNCQVDTPPVRNAYPTVQWREGEVIVDTYDLPAVPQGAHYLLIFYNPADGVEIGRASITP